MFIVIKYKWHIMIRPVAAGVSQGCTLFPSPSAAMARCCEPSTYMRLHLFVQIKPSCMSQVRYKNTWLHSRGSARDESSSPRPSSPRRGPELVQSSKWIIRRTIGRRLSNTWRSSSTGICPDVKNARCAHPSEALFRQSKSVCNYQTFTTALRSQLT